MSECTNDLSIHNQIIAFNSVRVPQHLPRHDDAHGVLMIAIYIACIFAVGSDDVDGDITAVRRAGTEISPSVNSVLSQSFIKDVR